MQQRTKRTERQTQRNQNRRNQKRKNCTVKAHFTQALEAREKSELKIGRMWILHVSMERSHNKNERENSKSHQDHNHSAFSGVEEYSKLSTPYWSLLIRSRTHCRRPRRKRHTPQ
jgi:hypothetical protein